MKSKIKKPIIMLVLLLSVLLIAYVSILTYNNVQYLLFDVGKYEINDFIAVKPSFETIATRLLNFYNDEQENNKDLKYIVISTTPSDSWELTCVTDTLNRSNDYVIFKDLSKEEREAYRNISSSFAETDSRGLYFIKIMPDRVIFATQTPYAIVYMKDGGRPDYILSENETYESIFVDKLSSKWYQAIGK